MDSLARLLEPPTPEQVRLADGARHRDDLAAKAARRGVELRSRPLPPHHWPRILTWSDDQAAEVERWLVDSTAELPEVLDNLADPGHACTGCIGDGPCVAQPAEEPTVDADEVDAADVYDEEREPEEDGE